MSQTGTVTAPIAVATDNSNNPLQAAKVASANTASDTGLQSIDLSQNAEDIPSGTITVGIGWED